MDVRRFRPIVTPASRAFVVLLPQGEKPPVDLAIAAGWQRGLSDLEELRNISLIISKQGGVVLRMFGEFDDREAGVDCIMSEDTFERVTVVLRRSDAS